MTDNWICEGIKVQMNEITKKQKRNDKKFDGLWLDENEGFVDHG